MYGLVLYPNKSFNTPFYSVDYMVRFEFDSPFYYSYFHVSEFKESVLSFSLYYGVNMHDRIFKYSESEIEKIVDLVLKTHRYRLRHLVSPYTINMNS